MTAVLDRALGYRNEVIRNRIVNSAMMVSQENGSTAGTTSGYYAVDQFYNSVVSGGTFTFGKIDSVTPGGAPNRIRFTVTATDTSIAASDIALIGQDIEGLSIADLQLGSGSAKTVTLRFGVKAPAGTYCVALENGTQNRAYVAEYVISASEANTDVVKKVTIPLDQSGTWSVLNTSGIRVFWVMMAGSTYQTTANSWQAGNFVATANQFNLMGTNGNVFELFDVGLYEGSVAPAYVVPDYILELTRCKRYFQVLQGAAGFPIATGSANATTNALLLVPLPVPMRDTPTYALSSFSHFAMYNGAVTPTSTTVAGSNDNTVRIDVGCASGLTVGQGVILLSINAAAKFHLKARM